jgi:hypothetical protein
VTSHATLSSSDQIEYQFVTLTQLEELNNVFISMSLCTIIYTWSLPRKVRNKLIHIKFGNHNPHIKVASLNIGGFAAPTKWLAIKQMDFDVVALCEAHPQDHVQHLLYLQFPDHHVVHSPGSADKHFSGVSFLIKKSICWAHQSLQWSPDHPCFKFAQDNR